MNKIEPYLSARVHFAPPVPTSRATRETADSLHPVAVHDGDDVQFSGEATALADRAAPARFSMISRIRGEIQTGAFETDARIDGTVDRLIELLGLGR